MSSHYFSLCLYLIIHSALGLFILLTNSFFDDHNNTATGNAQYIALGLLPLTLALIIYGVRQFTWRLEKIKFRDNTRWDDPMGPIVMTLLLLVALIAQLVMTVRE